MLGPADFGQLVTAGHVDGYPVVVPTHFLYDGDSTVLLHLARPNPVWKALDADPHVVLSLTGDYTYVEADWNANPDTDPTYGVPTSYYTAVQLLCTRRGRRRPRREGRDPRRAARPLRAPRLHPRHPDRRRRERPPPAPRDPWPATAHRERARQDEVRRQQDPRAPARDRRPPHRTGRPDGRRCAGQPAASAGRPGLIRTAGVPRSASCRSTQRPGGCGRGRPPAPAVR